MIKTYAIIGVLIISISAVYYVNNIVNDLANAKIHITTLNAAIKTQEKTIKGLNKDFTDANNLNKNLREVQNSQQQEIASLNEKFNTKGNGKARDIGTIARAKAGLITNIVNRATVNTNRCFELITGAEKTQGENNECKNLISSISN